MPEDSPIFLTLDVGSQSVRACLIDAQGTFHGLVRRALDPPTAAQPGGAETPAEHFWSSVLSSLDELREHAPQLWTSIVSVGLTTQRASVVALDRHGQTLRPVLLWPDQRRCAPPDSLGLLGIGMRAVGVHGTVKQFQSEAEINYLAAEEPSVHAKLDKFLLLSGYLNFRLTGEFRDSYANQVGYLPFDYRKHAWAHPRKWHWKALPTMRREFLPDLVSPGTLVGALSKDAAAQTGLPVNLPVVACATDKACETLGTGCLSPQMACLSFGTASTVNVTSPRYREVDRFVPAYPAAVPGEFLCEQQTHKGFWLVSWFNREFGKEEQRTANAEGVPVESLFDAFLRDTPPGANGLVAQPYWSPGVRVPGPEARGALIGFNASHTRQHIYRALIEGLAFALREGLEKIEKKLAIKTRCIRAAGGGSQSDEVLQLAADVLGRRIERAHTFEASSLGAAICASVASKTHASFAEAVACMTRPGESFEPDRNNALTYNQLYNEVYRPLYARLQPLYRRLAEQPHTSTTTSNHP